MRYSRATAMAVVVTTAFAGLGLGQSPRLQNLKVEAGTHPDFSVEFDLRAPSGDLLRSLSSGDVVVIEEGRRVGGRLTSGPPRGGAAFVFAVDTSGSMRRVLPEAREALAAFTQKLGSSERVALLTFNNDAAVLLPLTSDRATVEAAIRVLDSGGSTTELYYGVDRALEQFDQAGLPDRRILVVISDGKNEGTAYTLDGCLAKANRLGVNILGIGIASDDSRALLNVQRMAEETGGLFLRFESGQDWTTKLQTLRAHVDSRWSFAWTTTLPADGNAHSAQLEVNLGGVKLVQSLTLALPLIKDKDAEARELLILLGAGFLVLVGAGVAVFMLVRAARSREARRKALEQKVAEASDRIEDLTGKVDNPPTQEKEVQEDRPAPPPSPPPAKKRTDYYPGTPKGLYKAASLLVTEGPLAGSELPLNPDCTTIGREDDNNIVLDEGRVSGYHATVTVVGGAYYLEDLGSRNGTFIDTETIPIQGRRQLLDGQTVRIGGARLKFHGLV